ncbi:MAG: hypothetical protein IPJ17_20120 [Holophagales bacterium]|nr:MAG: hypothetical protein IPJ17_20120 [Holophagales bacterium]
MRRALPALSLLLLAAATACGGAEKASAPPTVPAGSGNAASRPAAVLSLETPAAAPAPAAGTGSASAGLSFAIPASWPTSAPSSNMRIAQATIPGKAGAGALAVFYFGPGGGGDVESNLQRWIGQVGVAQGTQPARERFEVNGLAVTWIDVKGSLLPSTMGTGPSTEQPGSRLFGAVIEGPNGPWFFKATGPEATMEAAKADFLAMLRSCRAAS